MITRTIVMHDVSVVRMNNGEPVLDTVKGYAGDISNPNKLLATLKEYSEDIIAITGISDAYAKRFGMSEYQFILNAKCLDK